MILRLMGSGAVINAKRVLITGGTGSVGRHLLDRLASGRDGSPFLVRILSRDESKQHTMQLQYREMKLPFRLEFMIGDIRDYNTVVSALQGIEVVFNAAAMKYVPQCEYHPQEAIRTNIDGAENIVRAIAHEKLPVQVVVGCSTDKACRPSSVMGMTKALQERIFIHGNLRCPNTKFVCVRYGNILTSRGSVLQLFLDQLESGGPLTITDQRVSRFIISLDDAVDTILAAATRGQPGDTFVPRAHSALMTNVALALIGDRNVGLQYIGLRPGEKMHEELVSEDEARYTRKVDRWYAISSLLSDLAGPENSVLSGAYCSDTVTTLDETCEYLRQIGVIS